MQRCRYRIVLQQVHNNDRTGEQQQQQQDDDRQQTTNDNEQQQQPATRINADEACTQFATANAISKSSESTPDIALFSYDTDCADKRLLPQLEKEVDDTSKLQSVVTAWHANVAYEPRILQLQQKQRERNLAQEIDIRRWNMMVQQVVDQGDKTEETKKDTYNEERAHEFFSEATCGAWADSAARPRQN